MRWKRGLPVKWLGAIGWFAIALLEMIDSMGSVVGMVSWISRYGASVTLLRFGSGLLSTLCVASAALYFGLSEIAERRTDAGQTGRLVRISRVGFVVLILLLGVLDILKILPGSGYMTPGSRMISCVLGLAESALAVMLLARFRVRFAAVALAAVYVLMIPVQLLGNLQALHMMPLLWGTLPSFILALAGGALALAGAAPSDASLDTSPHAP
jgi:hypothetical protein